MTAIKTCKNGRPSKYSTSLAERICGLMARGFSLRRICAQQGFPSARTVHRWLDENREFCQQYARAREEQADFYAAQIIELADVCMVGEKVTTERIPGKKQKNGRFAKDKFVVTKTVTGDMVERSKLQIEARMWYAGKLAPKKYGEHLELGGTVALDGEIAVRLAAGRKRLAAGNAARPTVGDGAPGVQ